MNINCFRPVTRKGMFTIPQSDKQTEWLCAALALFQEFLIFASKHNDWITQEQAREILLRYWQLVLPESAPQADNGQASVNSLDYSDPEVFYHFLSDSFLPTYRQQVIQGKKGTSETMGLIRDLNGAELFITPRKNCLEAFVQWLRDHHSSIPELSSSRDEAPVQRRLMDAGIPLRGEKKNPATWRYAFWGKDNGLVACFALPLRQLPEQVQTVFGTLFGYPDGAGDVPIETETVPNTPEGGNPL